MRRRSVVMVLALAAAVAAGDAAPAAPRPAAELKTARFLPPDALFAGSMKIENLGRTYDAVLGFAGKFVPEAELQALLAPLREWEERVGVGLRDDVLALVGGEAAFAVAIEDLDRLGMLAMSVSQGGEPPDLGGLLGGLMGAVGVFDGERFDGALAKLLTSVGARLEIGEDGLRTLYPPEGSGLGALLHYRYHGGFAVWSFSPATLAGAVARFDAGGGLRSSAEYQEVFAHLDPDPDGFGYLGLARLQALLRSSNLARAGLAQAPEAAAIYAEFVDGSEWGSGIGWASYAVPGGTVQQTFAPFDLNAFAAAYGGIVAAVAVPNFLNAVDRGKQKRSMADIRSVATSIEAYAVDTNRYPIVPERTAVADSPLPGLLSPTYIRTLPAADGWGNPFFYQSTEDGSSYTLWSFGKDGEPTEGADGATADFIADIVFRDGSFVRWPEGVQQ